MEAVITDKKFGVVSDTNSSLIAYYKPEITMVQDFYPFGWPMSGRTWETQLYRYGFNGKETENDVKGKWNSQDYGMRVYDPRVGRFLSVDPITAEYPELTPYQFASNRPIDGIDQDGLEFISPDAYNDKNPMDGVQKAAGITLKTIKGMSKALWTIFKNSGPQARELHPKKYDDKGNEISEVTGKPVTLTEGLIGFDPIYSYNKIKNTLQNGTIEEKAETITQLFFGGYALFKGGYSLIKGGKLYSPSGVFELNEFDGFKGSGYKVDLMGGPQSSMGDKWINFDIQTTQGIAADVSKFPKFFRKGSVSEIIVNNPQAEFLAYVAESMQKGGVITIRGQMANKFFKEIWNGKAKGIENFEVLPNSQKTGLPKAGYSKSNNERLGGEVNSINEIQLIRR